MASDRSVRRHAWLLPIALLLSAEVHAIDAPQIHGFATQSFISTSTNDFFGRTSGSRHFDFTEIGINASYRPHNDLLFSGQLLSRRAGETDGGKIRIDYALVDYTVTDAVRTRWGLRAGRMLNPLGLYNETRDVAFARPSIFLPQSIYFDRVRDLAISSDGLYLYGERRFQGNELLWQIGAGYPRVGNEEIERSVLSRLMPGRLDSSDSFLGRLLLEIEGGRYLIGISGAKALLEYTPGSGDILRHGQVSFSPVILSTQYNGEYLEMTAEYAQRSFTYEGFGPYLKDNNFVGESAYVQGIYRFRPHWDLLLRYDVLYTDQTDRHGKDFARAHPGIPAFSRFARDLTIGTGWQYSPSLLLRAEFHHVVGTAWLTGADNPDPSAMDRTWDMFALLVSYRF